jgi:hypothetical protein
MDLLTNEQVTIKTRDYDHAFKILKQLGAPAQLSAVFSDGIWIIKFYLTRNSD